MLKRCLILAAVLGLSVFVFAQSEKPCEELKSEIAKKIEANQVKSFSLEIVPKTKEVQGKVVGTCEGGTRKIVYTKTPPPQRSAEQTKKQ
jgi:uncharacterized protein YpmB